MKIKMVAGAFGLLLLLGSGAYAVSRILITQVTGDNPSPTGSVAITLPNSRNTAWAKIGNNLSVSNGVLNDTVVTPPPPPTLPIAATEIVTGTLDGTNVVFTLSNVPIQNTLLMIRNGLVLFPSAGDYVISGNAVTFQPGTIPQVGDTLVAFYQHQ